MWPFKRKAPEVRAAFPTVTGEYIAGRQKVLQTSGGVNLSATVATCGQTWGRAFAMLTPALGAETLTPDVLAAIGFDLCMSGESCWHIRVERGDLRLHRVAYWDELGGGKFHLHLARPGETETVRAIEGEVLRLTVNAPADQPWRGRSPFALMGASPRLMAEIEGAVSGAMEWTARGLLPFPDSVPEEQQNAALRGLKGGGMLAAIKSRADFAANTGQSRANEFKRVDLTPDLQKADLHPATEGLHHRLLTACGIPPALVTPQGNAGAMREGYRLFVLQTIEPLARTLLPELAKVGVTKMDSSAMLSADVAGRARAVGVLVTAGVPLEKAMRLAGWEDA
ncbi:hypothetical protein [Tateyamaria sp. SN6-1]|uniref:hypothetical protein n=1 Tax=Tateyamaria sp. SN6-1 TaxID=3092148 RepID=UPI0039F628BC